MDLSATRSRAIRPMFMPSTSEYTSIIVLVTWSLNTRAHFGKLYASQGKEKEALRQLANDVYFSSLQVGPEHIDTAGTVSLECMEHT